MVSNLHNIIIIQNIITDIVYFEILYASQIDEKHVLAKINYI
jgi:hypothetical protein